MSFLKEPLQDISISRSNERAKNWGVPVPSDPTQKIYVWFDALQIYQTGIGFGWDEEKYKKWWLTLWAIGIIVGSQLHFFGFFSLIGISGLLILFNLQYFYR